MLSDIGSIGSTAEVRVLQQDGISWPGLGARYRGLPCATTSLQRLVSTTAGSLAAAMAQSWPHFRTKTCCTTSHKHPMRCKNSSRWHLSDKPYLEACQPALALLQADGATCHGCECVHECICAEDGCEGLLQADLLEPHILIGTDLQATCRNMMCACAERWTTCACAYWKAASLTACRATQPSCQQKTLLCCCGLGRHAWHIKC